MADIEYFIKSQLLEPLKNYPTIIQDTMIEIISQKLKRLYEYTLKFPEIVSPNKNRLDILKAISDQFLFTVREDADIQEQINILDKILFVYSRRGSIDTIENMWEYYGGNLPKDVKVIIPSYNLFRYSMSKLSGIHKFVDGAPNYIILDTPSPSDIPRGTLVSISGSNRHRVTPGIQKNSYQLFISTVDGLSVGDTVKVGEYYSGSIVSIYDNSRSDINRPGIYEIRLTNNTYPIPDLRDFLIKELVAAGNLIYFTNSLHADLTNSKSYPYKVEENTLISIEMPILKSRQGLTLSGNNPLSPNPARYIYDTTKFSREDIDSMTSTRDSSESLYSGRGSIFLEFTILSDPVEAIMNIYEPYEIVVDSIPSIGDIRFNYSVDNYKYEIHSETKLYCTPGDNSLVISSNLDNSYPGYFILGVSLLGEKII